MSLLKRGNIWWSYFYVDGIRHQYSTGTSSRRKAENIEKKLKDEVNDHRFQIVQADPHVTFGALAAQFVSGGPVRPHHIYHLKFLLPFFAEFPALRITKSLAEDFRSARKQHNPSIKDATVNRDLSVLRRILYWAVDEQLLAANPLFRMKMARERKTRRQVLSVAEEQSLLQAAKNHLYAMTLIALDTGMRRGEITTQRWDDIDFAQKVLFVTHSKTPEGESREIPLTERLYKHLLGQRKADGLVIDFKGRPVRIVKRTWKTALNKASIRYVRFHDLRHTFNTRLMEAGVLQEIRMALMGHSEGSRVHAIYTHIELPAKREAIRKLEQWVTDQQTQLKVQQENHNASPETHRSESASDPSASSGEGGAQTLEEKVASRNRTRSGGKAEGRNCRGGRRPESKEKTAREIRAGQKAVRSELTHEVVDR